MPPDDDDPSTPLPTLGSAWADGVRDAIAIVKSRQQFYALYRTDGPIRAHPAVFATIEEILTLLRAMLSRGKLREGIPVD